MHRTAFIDEVALARGFKTDDIVHKASAAGFITPFVGRVLYSNTATGVVAVQWPWGVELESPSCLIVGDGKFAGPESVAYPTWEMSQYTRSKTAAADVATDIAREFERRTMPVYRMACQLMHGGHSEMDTLDIMLSRHGFEDEYGFDTLRRTVANLYELGRRYAIYWKDGNRRYRVTQSEKSSGKFKCPRCAGQLKPRVYRAGQRLMQCRGCGFSIHQKDLI